ncbi:MAG: non-ribosomal peptide synthetase [Gammaproteobacteria bacterium]|nr:non-ribosomal peptide synthetase [Gammaproteobacteria bacterium]
MTRIATLDQALQRAAQGAGVISHLKRDHALSERSYAELHAHALGLLGLFQSRALAKSSPLVLLLDDSEAFVDCFWAALLGGIVPVPVAVGGQAQQRERLRRIVAALGPCHICTTTRVRERMLNDVPAEAAELILLDEIYEMPAAGTPAPLAPEDIAFIQFSSGSTASPRGVVLSHQNLLTNMQAISSAGGILAEDNSLSWMPLTHDMGLIGFHLTPTLLGLDHTLMSTELFVRSPMSWLEQASEQQASVLCSPSFGYRHLLKSFRPERAAALALGSVRLLFNGAEPISVELCEQFCVALADAGLRRDCMFPVYGLAEASLAVSFPPPGRALQSVSVDRHALRIGEPVSLCADDADPAARYVRLGTAVPDCEIRIADEDGRAVDTGRLGHILIRGANVTTRYYTEAGEYVAARDPDGWLDTGDLGFMHGGELVVTGRAKETIVVNGHNYHPNDLESLLEPLALVDPARIAVCGSRRPDQATDEILVFVQHRGDPTTLADTARTLITALGRDTGLEIAHIVPVERIPRTTSGKPQRFKLVADYQNGVFEQPLRALEAALGSAGGGEQATTPTQARLLEICNRFLVHKNVGVDQNLLEIGESSLTLAMVYDEIENVWPGVVEIGDLLEHPTVAALAALIDNGPGHAD